MLQALREARQNEKGFTLIELLIVIVILGVLAGIVVFAVGAFNSDGVSAACKSDVKNVEIASEAYYAKVGGYATAIDDATHTATTLVGAKYLKEAPSSAKYTISYVPASGAVSGNC
ncbi:MAG TPA: prepilin-type N-terminal cleavage/methylation domain-containing protein [Jatrophihabitantaceae bacterium]|jgi:general secretion pathway protein G